MTDRLATQEGLFDAADQGRPAPPVGPGQISRLTAIYHRSTMPAMNPDELKAWRKSVDLTQDELAAHLGVAKMTVSRWETGDRSIPSFLQLALKTIERDFLKKRKRPASAGTSGSGGQ